MQGVIIMEDFKKMLEAVWPLLIGLLLGTISVLLGSFCGNLL